MFRSTTIIRELAIEPGYSYIDIKTFGKVMSLIVMRWCGSVSQYDMCIVSHSAQHTVHTLYWDMLPHHPLTITDITLLNVLISI